MNPSAWIALASLAAAMFVQAILFSFVMGRLFQDVAGLKSAGPERTAQGVAIARLEVKVENIGAKIDEMATKIDERWRSEHPAPPRPRSKPRAGE
jgi:hypothetical protein